jgi:hypothetical protein
MHTCVLLNANAGSVFGVQAMKPHGTYIQGTVTKLTDKQAWLEGVEAPLSFDYVAICSGSDYSFGKSAAPTPEAVHEEYQVCVVRQGT